MLRPIVLSALVAVTLADPAFANGKPDIKACKALQATLAPREAEIAELTRVRDASAVRIEEAGSVWEDAEIHRLVSAAHAETADAARAEYEAAKQAFARHELAVQSAVQAFNTDVSVFNTRCSG